MEESLARAEGFSRTSVGLQLVARQEPDAGAGVGVAKVAAGVHCAKRSTN